MPFTPNSPETKQIPTAVQDKALDVYHIYSFQLLLGTGALADATCKVQWFKGYNGEDGKFIPVVMENTELKGQPLVDKLSELVTSGKSRYVDVKNALWSLLQSEGATGDGSIS